jgi:hypothetical protein
VIEMDIKIFILILIGIAFLLIIVAGYLKFRLTAYDEL